MRISNILVLLGGIFLLGVGIWTFQNKTFTNDLLRYSLLGCLRKWFLEFRESRNLYENGFNFAKFRVIFHKIMLSLKELRHGLNDSYLRLC
jgi:hypothetical protein